MMSWYILGYNNRKLSSVYTGRLGCDVIFLLFLSTPTPCLPRPCHWLPWYICFLRLKYYKVTTLKEEKGKWGRETERHILKGWFPSHHSHGAQPPPHPRRPPTHCYCSSPDWSQKLGLLRHERMCLSKLQKWKRNSPLPSTDESQKRSPRQSFASEFPRATQAHLKIYGIGWWTPRRRWPHFQGLGQKKDTGELYPEAVPQFEANIRFQSEVSEGAGFGLGFRHCSDQGCTAWALDILSFPAC